MMSEYVTPTITCGNFTKGKHYKVLSEMPKGRVLIEDDAGETAIVRVDGRTSSKLDYSGKFYRVSFELNNALNIAARAEAMAWRLNRDGTMHINNAKIGGAIISKNTLIFQHNGKKHDALELVERNEQLEKKINELIAANEEVRKILRCPDGFDIRKQAQVVRTLADTLLDITK
nr:MAG TPA: hybrid alpha/beta peptide [Caudoviricetes sp.]